MSDTPKQGLSIRRGHDRIQYDPAWYTARPFKTFRSGTAGPCCATLQAAQVHLVGQDNYSEGWSEWQ